MDRIIDIKVGGNYISKDNKNAGVRGEANVTNLRITFDEGWDSYTKKITFWDARGLNPVCTWLSPHDSIDETGRIYLIPIPAEPMTEAGYLTFVIEGTIDDKVQRSLSDKLEVKDAPIAENAGQPVPPAEDELTKLEGEIEKIKGDILEAKASKEAIQNMSVSEETLLSGEAVFVKKTEKDGVVNLHFGIPEGDKGKTGDSGVHIGSTAPVDPKKDVWINPIGTPTNETGSFILSLKDKTSGKWVEVQALKGSAGYTPVKGVDYYTDEETDEQIRAINEAKESATREIEAKRGTTLISIYNMRQETLQLINDAEDGVLSNIDTTKEEALESIVEEKEQTLTNISDIGATVINDITNNGADALNNITIAKNEALEEINITKYAVKSKAKGESIYITDSAEEKLNNLIIYGKTTQAAEPTLEAPQELVSVGAKPFNVYVTGNNLFNPTDISASSKTITKYGNYGNIDSTEYDGEIKLISPKFKYNPDSTGADNYLTTYLNGTFYVWMDDAFMKRSLDGEIYTFIADVVLDERHNNEVSGEPAPDTISITGSTNQSAIGTQKVTWTGVNSEGKQIGKVACAFKNKHTKNEDGTINYEARNKIEVRTVGKSMTFTNIMLLPGDWTTNPPEYEDYKGQVLSVEAKGASGNPYIKGLPSVPVDNGGNYIDSSGKNWVANSVNIKEGKIYTPVRSRPLPAYGWNIAEEQLSTDENMMTYYYDTDWVCGKHLNVLCNYFPHIVEPKTGQGIWLSITDDNCIKINVTTSILSKEQFEAFVVAKQPYIYYIPQVPFNPTNLSDEEISAYKELATNYPITRVISDEDVGMEVEYVADTKNYIDNKIAELTALTLEG